MRIVLQRVSKASVTVDDQITGSIQQGLLLLIGVEDADTLDDSEWLLRKILNMRIFADEEGKMNKSILDVQGELLLVSQFTLHASTKKGNRPSFIHAAAPEHANQLYNDFIEQAKSSGLKVETGIFGANMQVELINDGPVTILLDSKNKE